MTSADAHNPADPRLGGWIVRYGCARSHSEPDRHGRPGRIDPGAGPSFSFQRVAAGPDGPLWGVRESLEYRDTVYLAGFGDSCSATRVHRSSLIMPGDPPVTARTSGDALSVLHNVVSDWPT
ncbi:MAG: hypothetical protein WBV74_00865 [Pseudonocardiaceae bacterium]